MSSGSAHDDRALVRDVLASIHGAPGQAGAHASFLSSQGQAPPVPAPAAPPKPTDLDVVIAQLCRVIRLLGGPSRAIADYTTHIAGINKGFRESIYTVVGSGEPERFIQQDSTRSAVYWYSIGTPQLLAVAYSPAQAQGIVTTGGSAGFIASGVSLYLSTDGALVWSEQWIIASAPGGGMGVVELF